MTNAGWYPSPSTPGTEQFWDGVSWTPQFRPLSATPFMAPPAHQADTVQQPHPGQPSDAVFPPIVGGPAPAPPPSSSGGPKALIASLALLAVIFVAGLALFLVIGRNGESEVLDTARAGTADGGGSSTAPTTAAPIAGQPEAVGETSGGESDGGGQADPGSSAPVAPDSVPLGEVLDTGAFRFLVHEVAQVEPANEFSVPDDGKVFVVVDLEITNFSEMTELFSSFDTEAFDDSGFSYDGDFNSPRRDPPLGYVLPGQTRRGDITFQVTEGTSLSYLVVKASSGDRTPYSLSLTGESAGAASTAIDGSAPTQPTDSVPFGQEVDTPTFRYLVHEATTFESEETFTQPQAGFVFVVVDLEITNLTDEAQTSTLFDVEAFDANGFSYRPDFVSPRNEPPFGDFLASQNRRGDLTFQVPAGTDLSYLIVAGFISDDEPVSLNVE